MSDERPADPQPLDPLEVYLERLQAGEPVDRAALLGEHPQLASAIRCLDLLDGVASDLAEGTDSLAQSDGRQVTEGPLLSGPTHSAEELPADFGAYELLEEIGRGGMGVVYKARQKGLDRTVAVKMILAGHLASAEQVRRFQIEAKAAAGLRHPHVVEVYEVGRLFGRDYFAMEYVDGISLAQKIATGRLDIEASVRLIQQVSRAVGHLHQQGIVHRDLKPSNILIDGEGAAYVSDFGLAKVFAPADHATTTGAILGTASYMAPEQASGHSSQATPAADVYSLGAILYELLLGHPPFLEENPLDTLMQVLTAEPTLPRQLDRSVPRSLELICLQCLAKPPDDRYPTAEALADDLQRYLNGEAPTVRAPNLRQRVRAWSRREPALVARLGMLGVFFAVEMAVNGLAPIGPAFHRKMLGLLAAWALTACVSQQLLRIPRWTLPARFMWGTLDSALLLTVLLVADGAASSLVVGYPLLIAASGLWFRVRFVGFMTALSLLSYGLMLVDFYIWRPELQESIGARWDRHVIFMVALVALGACVAYLVRRVRVLSRYCGQQL